MSTGRIFDSVRWHHWKLFTEARYRIGPLHNFSIGCRGIFRSDSVGRSVGWRVGQMSVGPLPCLRSVTLQNWTEVEFIIFQTKPLCSIKTCSSGNYVTGAGTVLLISTSLSYVLRILRKICTTWWHRSYWSDFQIDIQGIQVPVL